MASNINSLSLLINSYRLTACQLSSLELVHLSSNIVPSASDRHQNDQHSTIEGYTEWVSKTTPAASVGWDWTTLIKNKTLTFTISGYPYSNIKLTDSYHQELSESVRLELLKVFIETINWQEAVSASITERQS